MAHGCTAFTALTVSQLPAHITSGLGLVLGIIMRGLYVGCIAYADDLHYYMVL